MCFYWNRKKQLCHHYSYVIIIFSPIVFSCSVLCKFCVFFLFLLKGSSKCVFLTLLSCSGFIIYSLFASCIFIWTNKDDDDDYITLITLETVLNTCTIYTAIARIPWAEKHDYWDNKPQYSGSRHAGAKHVNTDICMYVAIIVGRLDFARLPATTNSYTVFCILVLPLSHTIH